MTNILLTVSYDGTDFCGWQRQDKADAGKSVRTVQGVLEHALEKMLGQHVDLQGSGRTDSGVHAAAQAANFMSPHDNIPIQKYTYALNGALPPDIRIISSEKKPDDFSSRYNATSRTYRYFIHTVTVPQARDMRYVWPIPFRPDVNLLNDMCTFLHGEMNCSTFAAAGDKSVSMNRCINQAHFWYEGDTLVFEIEANAFLWKMVRSVTGTLIDCTRNMPSIKSETEADAAALKDSKIKLVTAEEYKKEYDKRVQCFKQIVESHDRKQVGVTAPPQGLFLWKVSFDGVRLFA